MHSYRMPRTFLASIWLVCMPGLLNRADHSNPLQYKFIEDSTNAYRVSIELPSESNPMSYEGVILVVVRNSDDESGTVTFQTQLKPKAAGDRAIPPGFRPGIRMGPPGPFGQHPWANGWATAPLPQFNEAQFDHTGRLLRFSGLPELPKPIQTYAHLLFPSLPTNSTSKSQIESVLAVDDDSPGAMRGPPGRFYPGHPGGGPPRISGVQKETVETSMGESDMLRIHKTLEFRSWLKAGDQPRLVFSLDGEWMFDSEAGNLKTAKIKGTAVMATLDLVQRVPVTLQIDRLDGDELRHALAAQTQNIPAAVTEAELENVLADFRTGERTRRIEIANRLLASEPDRFADALLPLVLPFETDPDPSLQNLMMRVLAKGATVEEVPLLLRLLKQDDRGHHFQIIEALGRLRDQRSIQPLVDLIATGGNAAHQAANALGEFGPVVEEAALQLLKERHIETRRRVCEILQKAGTAKSVEPLQAIIGEGDQHLGHLAADAIRAIRRRAEEQSKMLF